MAWSPLPAITKRTTTPSHGRHWRLQSSRLRQDLLQRASPELLDGRTQKPFVITTTTNGENKTDNAQVNGNGTKAAAATIHGSGIASPDAISPKDEQLSAALEAPTPIPTSSPPMNTQWIWFMPPVLSFLAFALYPATNSRFHEFMDRLSGYNWVQADGGEYMLQIVRPVLNGPVTLSISILFGTLCSMTIQTLYNRQISIHKNLIATVEEVRELQLLVDGLKCEPYRSQAQTLLKQFVEGSLYDYTRHNSQVTNRSLQGHEQLSRLLLCMNQLANDQDMHPLRSDMILCEVYQGLHRLKDLRSAYLSAMKTTFGRAHYAVMMALSSILLFVFMLETDQNTLQFLLGFQLSICWGMLIGTYSMLAAVIYDLNSPFSGVFTTLNDVAELTGVPEWSTGTLLDHKGLPLLYKYSSGSGASGAPTQTVPNNEAVPIDQQGGVVTAPTAAATTKTTSIITAPNSSGSSTIIIPSTTSTTNNGDSSIDKSSYDRPKIYHQHRRRSRPEY